MKPDGTIKQEQIVDAAIKRFSYFGINKTTLSEIAEDLAISKPSLFYYFNDKNSLITAVAGKIINEFLFNLEAAFTNAVSVEEGLLSLVELKRASYKKYFLLAIQGETMDLNKIPSALPQLYLEAREKSVALLSNLLNKGIENGRISPVDTAKSSLLLIDTLTAFELCMRGRKAIPELKDIDDLFDKQKEVLTMFLNGLRTTA